MLHLKLFHLSRMPSWIRLPTGSRQLLQSLLWKNDLGWCNWEVSTSTAGSAFGCDYESKWKWRHCQISAVAVQR